MTHHYCVLFNVKEIGQETLLPRIEESTAMCEILISGTFKTFSLEKIAMAYYFPLIVLLSHPTLNHGFCSMCYITALLINFKNEVLSFWLSK